MFKRLSFAVQMALLALLDLLARQRPMNGLVLTSRQLWQGAAILALSERWVSPLPGLPPGRQQMGSCFRLHKTQRCSRCWAPTLAATAYRHLRFRTCVMPRPTNSLTGSAQKESSRLGSDLAFTDATGAP